MYNEEVGERYIKFISLLKATSGDMSVANKPIKLEPFQRKMIREIFGTLNEDGTRQYREAFMLIGRKNGKSEIIASMAIAALMLDNEYGAEIYSAANSQEQASIVFRKACQMIRTNKTLSKRLRIIESRNRIIRYDTNSVYKAISADSSTAHGFNAHIVIYDEIHEAKTRELYQVLKTSSGTRRQPLFISITTAGEKKQGIWWDLFEYAKKIEKGIIKDKTFYPALYYLESNDDWTVVGEPAEYDKNDNIIKEATGWYKANPALGKFRLIDEMLNEFRRAKEIPANESMFKRLYLNMVVNTKPIWLQEQFWEKCFKKPESKKLIRQTCYAGLDLSSTSDLTAFVLCFPIGKKYVIRPYFFIPEENIMERVRKDKVPYDFWIRQGYITATPGNVVDYNYIIEKIKKLNQIYYIKEIAFDRWGAAKLSQDLENEGFTMVAFGQGFVSMSPPTKELISLVLKEDIEHDNNPVLNWNSSNMVLRQDAAGNLKPDKENSTEKIDGMVAVVMALDRALRHKDERSVYEEEGIKVI